MTATELAVKKALLKQEFRNRELFHEMFCAGIRFAQGNMAYDESEVYNRLGIRSYVDIRMEQDELDAKYPNQTISL